MGSSRKQEVVGSGSGGWGLPCVSLKATRQQCNVSFIQLANAIVAYLIDKLLVLALSLHHRRHRGRSSLATRRQAWRYNTDVTIWMICYMTSRAPCIGCARAQHSLFRSIN